MQPCNVHTTTSVPSQGQGPGVTVFCNQQADDPGGWIVDLYAVSPGEQPTHAFAGRFTLTAAAANVSPVRAIGAACFPGVERWTAEVTPPTPAPARPISIEVCASNNTPLAPTSIAP